MDLPVVLKEISLSLAFFQEVMPLPRRRRELFISGQDWIRARGMTELMTDYLGVTTCLSD